MSDSNSIMTAEDFIARCGSFAAAVSAVASLQRQLWALIFAPPVVRTSDAKSTYRLIDEALLHTSLTHLSPEIASALLARLRELNLLWNRSKDDALCVEISALHPIRLARA